MSPFEDTVETISKLVTAVFKDPDRFDTLSTGERVAVAMVLDRGDLLKLRGWTILDAANRLGPLWLKAAISVQRELCDDEKALGYNFLKAEKAEQNVRRKV